MANGQIEENINLRVYYTPESATRAVKLSKLPPKEKKRLIDTVIPAVYKSTETQSTARSEPSQPKARFNGEPSPASGIQVQLLKLGVQILKLANEHRMSRSQIIDMINEQIESE